MRTTRAWVALWVVLGALLVLRTGGRDRGVIIDHLEFGRRLVCGEELYAPYLEQKPLHPVYPPSFGLLTAPFTVVPERVARYAWGLLQVGALGVIGWWLASMLRRQRADLAPRVNALLAVTALLGSRYILRDTHGGGGNLINLALAISAFTCAERKRTLFGALLLGFSLATKPTMALLVPAFLVMGRLRVAIAGGCIAIGFTGVALLLNGHGLEPLDRWLEGALAYGTQPDLFAPPHLGLPPFTWMNQSLRCAVVRYLGEVPPAFAAEVPGFVPGLGLPASVTAALARGLGLAVLGATLLVAWRRHATSAGRIAMLAAALAASLLLSPISWKAHHVALLPAFFLLLIRAVDGSRRARWLAFAYFALCTVGGGDVVGDAIKEWQQSLYLATFGTIALWLWLLAGGGEAALSGARASQPLDPIAP